MIDKLSKIEAVDLQAGKLTLQPNARTICYFLVNNTIDREAIRKIAMSLILSRCREFHFYGKQEALWHQIFDEVDIQLNTNASDEDIALTMGYVTLDDLLDELLEGASVRGFVPQQFVLFYDDDTEYGILKKKRERQMATITYSFGGINEAIGIAIKDGITYQIIEHKTEWVLKAAIIIATVDVKWKKKDYSSLDEFLNDLAAQGYKVEK